MHCSDLIPCLNLINFHKSTVIKITLEHKKKSDPQRHKKYANYKNRDNKNEPSANKTFQ